MQESIIVVAQFLLLICALALVAVLLVARVMCSRLTEVEVKPSRRLTRRESTANPAILRSQ